MQSKEKALVACWKRKLWTCPTKTFEYVEQHQLQKNQIECPGTTKTTFWERQTEIDTHVIDHDHQDHKPSVLQQNSSKERSRRNNKKKKVYANTSLFSLRAEEEEDEEEDFSLENSKDEIRYINIIVVRLERFFCVIKGFLIWLVLV